MTPQIAGCIARYNDGRQEGEPPMTQVRLARLLGVTQAAVSLWTRGKRAMTAETAFRIAQLLGCSMDDLFAPEVSQPVIAEPAEA